MKLTAGAIFALVLLLSTLHNHQTLTRNTSMTEDGSFNETLIIFQFEGPFKKYMTICCHFSDPPCVKFYFQN